MTMTEHVTLMFFFFQAEDGIRDIGVTGVQTCALPISLIAKKQIKVSMSPHAVNIVRGILTTNHTFLKRPVEELELWKMYQIGKRRVGKECRSRWSPYH